MAKLREEADIQDALITLLTLRGWLCKPTHGNMYQSGFPDVFTSHVRFGHRWVEVKKPKGYSFTPAQIEWFPQLCAAGSGVWVLTAATEHEYLKLFKPFNWHMYL